MNNMELKRIQRWNRFVELNAESQYCTTKLIQWVNRGTFNGYHDPRINKSDYKRTNCGRCGKCDQIQQVMELNIYNLSDIKNLIMENELLRAENRMLLNVIKAGEINENSETARPARD